MSSWDVSSSLLPNNLSSTLSSNRPSSDANLNASAGTAVSPSTGPSGTPSTGTAVSPSTGPSGTPTSSFAQALQQLQSLSSDSGKDSGNPDNTAVLEYMLDAYIQEMMSTFGGTVLASATSALSRPSSDSSDVVSPGANSSATAGSAGAAASAAAPQGVSASLAAPVSAASDALSKTSLYGVATQAAQMAGVPSTWVDSLVKIAMNESSGNPSAVNPGLTGDGEHAIGLMQTEPSTFRAYAAPGHTDITNPLDNMIAAIHYIESRYGDASTALHKSLNGGY